jgi:uncharacterized protein YndB with AHSA1/START domain
VSEVPVLGEADMAVAAGGRLSVQRHFSLPWQVVFSAWQQAPEIAKWFGPQGYTVPAYSIDVVEGGSYWMTLRSGGGLEYVVTGRFLAIEPPQWIAFTFRIEEGGRQGPETTVEVTLRPSQGGTVLTLEQFPFTSDELMENHRKAWESTLESLAIKLVEDQV